MAKAHHPGSIRAGDGATTLQDRAARGRSAAPSLAVHLDRSAVAAPLAEAIAAIAAVARRLSDRLSLGALDPDAGGRSTTLSGAADQAFHDALAAAGVRHYASQARSAAIALSPTGALTAAIDPLNGAAALGAAVPIGTIFSFFEAAETPEASLLRPGREQIAAGYVIYGPQTAMLLTTGDGVAHFVLDRATGAFLRVAAGLKMAESFDELAINASNYRHWPKPVRAFFDDCVAGEDAPEMRWVGSLVAETHRIIMGGGVFLSPAEARPGLRAGRLRLLHECAPIALLVEQTGGSATNGCDRILDLTPTAPHQRTPLVFGAGRKVAQIAAYHASPADDVAPLFGRRGLFTA